MALRSPHDIAIPGELRPDARLSNAELAPRRPSAAPTWRRVRWRGSGYITGYRAELDRLGSASACWPSCASMPTTTLLPRRAQLEVRSAIARSHLVPLHLGRRTFGLQVMATDLDAFSRRSTRC
jgi:hypothetical protein